MIHRWLPVLCVLALGSDDPRSNGRDSDQKALKPYAGFVGAWRGTGLVQRGNTKGAWTERGSWAWKLTKDSAALELTVEKGKYLKSAILRPGDTSGAFTLDAILADGSKRSFSGTAGERAKLVLATSDEDKAGGLSRITVTPLHDTRFLTLLESRDAESNQFARLGEVGYTREGVAFAAGDSYPACIVTEGRGTIVVSYKGKTYYVCCSGCKELFDEDPRAVLAEYERKLKEKAKAK